jgi:hypothetical protein
LEAVVSAHVAWVRLPADLFATGTRPEFLAEFAGLHIRHNSDGSCDVVTHEAHKRTDPPRVTSVILARGTEFDDRGLDQLASVEPLTQSTSASELARLRDLRLRFTSRYPDPEPLWAKFAGQAQIADDEQLVDLLRQIQREGDNLDSLWLVKADPILSRRLAAMRALFAARHAREAWQGGRGFEGFPAARSLMANTTAGFILYILLPLLYRTPWFVGVATFRAHATLVRMFATPQPGRDIGWGSPLDTVAGHAKQMERAGVPAPPWEPEESQEDREALFSWWADRVGVLMAFLSDFTIFRDEEGSYSPSAHLGTVLTVERLFVTAVEMMRIRTKNEWLRKLLFFDVLDLLEGQGVGTYEQNLHLTRQRKAWSEAREVLPISVVRCLRPLIDGGAPCS